VLQAAHNSKSTVPYLSKTAGVKPKQTNFPKPFSKYRFFLDIRKGDNKTRQSLIEDIQTLGGKIEVFLNPRDVTHVITDTPEWKLPGPTLAIQAGPPSPWTPTPTPSPATSTSLESTEKTKRPGLQSKSRVDLILEAARPSPNSGGSSDVLEVARRWNRQIWTLRKTLEWLNKFKSKYDIRTKSRPHIPRTESFASPQHVSQKPIAVPCIKLENTVRQNKPVFAELKNWPTLYLDGKAGSCPYSAPSSKEKIKKLAKRLDIHRDIRKPRKRSPEVKKKERGFCEICGKSYLELVSHLASEGHTKFVQESHNWAEVDEIANVF